jgi:hypothetical protein
MICKDSEILKSQDPNYDPFAISWEQQHSGSGSTICLCAGILTGSGSNNTSLLRVIHTCHVAPLPFYDSAVSFVNVRVVAGNIRSASPTVWRIGMVVIIFVEIRVVAGRSRTGAGRSHVVSGGPMLIHTCHAMPIPRCAVVLRSRFQNGMVVAWHGRAMGAAWARHGMCESNTAALFKSNGKDTI